MRRSIIITDLTRFKTGNPNVCIAGIDSVTGECIRPMPYLQFTECTQLCILPGSILTGDFTHATSRSAPHTEDCNYQDLKLAGPCSGAEFRKVLTESAFADIDDGFELTLPQGEKVIPAGHRVQRSIITLQVEPSSIEIVEDTFQSGKIKLHFRDGSGRRYRFFPITDLGFYDYAQRHRESGALQALNNDIAGQQEVFLRIGLSRSYRNPQGKEGYWLQANGIYTFPNVLRYIRSYPSAKTSES